MDKYSSRLLEDAIDEFAKLPGIGRKTALRLVLHMLKQEKNDVEKFSNAMTNLRSEITYCKVCYNISDTDVCRICSNDKRDRSLVCVVSDIRDVMAIENTQQYTGVYHVLGGIISPMDGIGPQDINVDQLIDRIKEGNINEVILALSTTMEGEMTNHYIYKRLSEFDLNISTIAKGVSIGDEIEYADEVTLGQSILNRLPYK